MFNPFVIKKWTALILLPMISLVSFYATLQFKGMLWAIGALLISLLITAILGSFILKNPFSDMLEGKGILVQNMDSTGVVHTFIVAVRSPFIEGKLNDTAVKDVFDRESVYQIATPVKCGTCQFEGEELVIRMTKKEFQKARFQFYTYPMLIWNDQIKSMMTKDMLSQMEKQAFTEHTILYLNRKIEELSAQIRDFARYVIDQLKPSSNLLSKWWIWLLIGGVVILLGALFLPKIMASMQGKVGGAVSSASGNQIVTPQP